jgi:hypothetical protein
MIFGGGNPSGGKELKHGTREWSVSDVRGKPGTGGNMDGNKVAIVGICQTKYEAAKRNNSLAEMIFEATSGALRDAGLRIGDIDTVVLAAHDLMDGRSITSMLTAPPAGAHMKDECAVQLDRKWAGVTGHLCI